MGDSNETGSGAHKPAPSAVQARPAWIKCELCERAVSAVLPRLSAAFAGPDQQVPQTPGSLILLCRDCMTLIRGEIDEDEWRRRTTR
jgi:hypothetical protein